MNIYLPYPSFVDSAKALDNGRLGRQRIQIIRLLRKPSSKSRTAQMWRHHQAALATYGLYISAEWTYRGHDDSFSEDINDLWHVHHVRKKPLQVPAWMGEPEIHRTYRELLLYEAPDHYLDIFPDDDQPFDEPEFPWPSESERSITMSSLTHLYSTSATRRRSP